MQIESLSASTNVFSITVDECGDSRLGSAEKAGEENNAVQFAPHGKVELCEDAGKFIDVLQTDEPSLLVGGAVNQSTWIEPRF